MVKFRAALMVASLASVVALFSCGALAADAVHGQAVFKAHCALCHSVQPGKEMLGPSLFGIIGRPSCADPQFHYSHTNCAANLAWTEPTLDKYVAPPTSVFPGTRMPFRGLPDPVIRADLLAYLATLK